MNNAVDMKNISFSYDNKIKILDDTSFTLEYGKVTLLAGLSGEGKSTIFNIINGIIPNSTKGFLRGEVLIDGKNIHGLTIGEISRFVGSVLQNPELQIIQPTVKDEIAFGCENLGMPTDEIHEKVIKSCELLGLDPLAKSHRLSGGQKQKLITATTLAMGQKILILDEPLANLDKKSSRQLLELLNSLAKKEHYAVLIIEHRLDVLADYIDELKIIKDKKIETIENKKDFISGFSKTITSEVTEKNISNNILKLENIHHKFKKNVIFNGLNLEINSGERVVILGQNGCGKTTLTRIIAKLLRPKKGTIKYNFKAIEGEKPRKFYKKVGYVYQNPNYQLFMPTVSEEILFNGYSLDYCQKIVDMFDLGALLHRHPHSLSEGQKRKVTIASVLSSKPDIVILDEPTVGQDYKNLSKLVEIINKINQENKTTFLTITHDIRCVEALCDKAIVIKNNKVDEIGSTELAFKTLNI